MKAREPLSLGSIQDLHILAFSISKELEIYYDQESRPSPFQCLFISARILNFYYEPDLVAIRVFLIKPTLPFTIFEEKKENYFLVQAIPWPNRIAPNPL